MREKNKRKNTFTSTSRSCFLSFRRHGQPVVATMGVVVQAMVEAEAAGVAFSRDPDTGDPSRVLITANYGLGEV